MLSIGTCLNFAFIIFKCYLSNYCVVVLLLQKFCLFCLCCLFGFVLCFLFLLFSLPCYFKRVNFCCRQVIAVDVTAVTQIQSLKVNLNKNRWDSFSTRNILFCKFSFRKCTENVISQYSDMFCLWNGHASYVMWQNGIRLLVSALFLYTIYKKAPKQRHNWKQLSQPLLSLHLLGQQLTMHSFLFGKN